VALADRRRHGTFQPDAVLEHRVEVLARDHRVGARVDGGADVLLVPGHGHARGVEDGADGVGDLGADAFFFDFFRVFKYCLGVRGGVRKKIGLCWKVRADGCY